MKVTFTFTRLVHLATLTLPATGYSDIVIAGGTIRFKSVGVAFRFVYQMLFLL